MNAPAGQRMSPVFTIGYEGRTINDFLADLRANDIKLLADVREAPTSRKRGFSKSALASALQDAGIDYLHLRCARIAGAGATRSPAHHAGRT